MKRFLNKKALVTGGASGIGKAICQRLVEEGADLVFIDRNIEAGKAFEQELSNQESSSLFVAADLTKANDCEKVVEYALNRYGRLDVLDNNIGIASNVSVLEESEEYLDRVMEINLKPMFLMSKYAIPAMISSGDGGSIVNISSISATRPKGLTAYSTSKGAVLSLTQAMAVDHGSDGIRVNCILPGPVYTPMVYASSSYLNQEGMSSEQRSQRQNASLLQIEGEGWDIGKAVVYLSSNWARYITGHLMVVDGGCSLSARARG